MLILVSNCSGSYPANTRTAVLDEILYALLMPNTAALLLNVF